MIMSEGNRKLALILCSCGKTLEKQIDYEKILRTFNEDKEISQVFLYGDLCFEERLHELVELFKKKTFDWAIIAACTPQIIEMIIKNELKMQNIPPNFEIVNIREECAWVHTKKEKATDKVVALINGVIRKIKYANTIMKRDGVIRTHATIVGGGIAGLNVALDLSNLGFDVVIIEKNPWVGGHVLQLNKVSPFNETGKEIIRAQLTKLEGKNVEFKSNTRIQWIDGGVGKFKIHAVQAPLYINERCDSCGKCIEVCPITLDDPLNKGLRTIKVVDEVIGKPFSQSLVLYRESCPIQCNRCAIECPQNAIDLSQPEEEMVIDTSFIVFATGYELFRPDTRSVYHPEKYDNVFTQLELARMLDVEGPTKGKVIIPSSGESANKILMIQCVGSRDIGTAEYCSKYCCSTAIRHAIEIKERNTASEVWISYIDIRTPFWDEAEYRKARELGVEFVRGKIGNIHFQTGKFVTEIVDTVIARQINYESDVIILSTAMLPSQIAPEISEISHLKLSKDGFIKPYYPKLKLTETNKIGIYVCGTAGGPKLVPDCIAEAHSVALSIVKEYPSELWIKERAVSIVNEELCNGCELCVRICPFSIPVLIQKGEDSIAFIDGSQCQGCGTCVSLCPTNAVQLESLQRDQLFAQIKGTLADAPDHDDPIILGFVCEECAYATIDFAGMLKKTYAESVRLIRIPCAGRLSILDILTALEYGADFVLIFGCEPDKCHYLEGNTRTGIIIEVVNEILQEVGWDCDRVQMYGLFSADVEKFMDGIRKAVATVEKLGHAPSRLKLLSKIGERG